MRMRQITKGGGGGGLSCDAEGGWRRSDGV